MRRAARLLPALVVLSGCAMPASPSVPFYGAYFPSWLLCAALGVAGALLARVILVWVGVDAGIPFRAIVYICLALLIAFVAAATIYGL